MDSLFTRFDAWIIGLGLALAMLGGWGAGWWLGCKAPSGGESASGRFVDGSMAILGLLLGFTFAVALGKHDQRRLMIVADSNSIGDFYTCASMLKDPVRTRLESVVREYVDLRLEVIRRKPDRVSLEQSLQRMEEQQDRMRQLVTQAVNDGTPVTVPLVNTLNGVTSNHASLLAAYRDRLSTEVIVLLFMAAVISAVLVRRNHAATQKPQIAATISYIALVALAVCVILDLNHPSRGLITVSSEPLQRLAQSIGK